MPTHRFVPAPFDTVRQRLEKQYEIADYTDGWSREQLLDAFKEHCTEFPEEAKLMTKAWFFNLICSKAPIAPEVDDYFVGKVAHYDLLLELRNRWRLEAARDEFGDRLGVIDGSYRAMLDCCSHICPDWQSIFSLGIDGIYQRSLSGKSVYHQAVATVFDGVKTLLKRFDAVHPTAGLAELASRKAQSFQEALQLSYLFNELIEFDGIQVRSMGRFDKLFSPYYERDIANGTLTRSQAAELLKYYWIKFFAKTRGLVYGKPFTFGPEKYALSELAFEVYNELDIVDPKFHFRVSENTPPDLLMQVSNLICNGRTAVVMVNNDMQKSMLQANGKTPEDADDYILIGCYEPAVMGVELNCSGAGTLNLAKAVEQVILSAPEHWQYEDVKQAYFIQLQKNLEQCIADLKRFERLWSSSNPAPLFSGPMQSCHERGKDISEAGAKYNTTGICCVGLPDAVDSLIAVGELFKRKLITSISELKNILLDNWQKHELLRQIVLHKFPSWGNDNADVDALAVEIADAVGSWINKTDNTRNGKFQAALYAILPTAQLMGKYTGALPNGRLANTVLTMNTNCENGRDLNGVTAILRSAAKLPLHWFVNGTTLDITLHPSVVSAGKGAETVCSLIRSYFNLGGTTLQFNVFNRKMLLEAQQNPAAYANLQIRVCGWNVRFIDLAPEEQQIFIDRANGGNSC